VSSGSLRVAPAGFTIPHKMLREWLIECGMLSKHFTEDLQRDQKGDKATWDLYQWATNVHNETNFDESRYNTNFNAPMGFTAHAAGE
jgi:hypothetical protein